MLTPFQNRALRALSENPFFGRFSEDCMRSTFRKAVRRGEPLFEKGEPSDAIYGLVSGQLKLFSAGAEGRLISFGIKGPGELVGAIGLVSDAPRHLSVMALAHSELAAIRRRDLEPLFERHPGIREALASAAAEAARELSERIEDAAFLSIEARVEKTIRDFARRFGEPSEAGTSVPVRQQDLADVLGLSRESVSRVLTSPNLRRRLRLGRGRITLLGG